MTSTPLPSKMPGRLKNTGWPGIAGLAIFAVGTIFVVWSLLAPIVEIKSPFSLVETNDIERLLKSSKPSLPEDIKPKSFAVRVEGLASPVAEGVALIRDGNPLSVLAWRNTTPEAVLSPDINSDEIFKVVEAIKKHTKADDTLIGFPGFLGSIARLSDRSSLIKGGGIRATLLPAIWQDQRAAVSKHMDGFWRGANKSDANLVQKFYDALLNDELAGAASLAALAKGKRSFLVLNITDVLRLGAVAPDRFHIGYRDFPGASRAHGVIKAVKGWLKQNNYESYAVEQRDADYSRVYFLGKPELKSSLIARALPFSTTNPMQLDVLRLVYQTGGTWIFQINPLNKTTASTASSDQ